MAATEQKGDEREDTATLRGDEYREKESVLNPLLVFPAKLKWPKKGGKESMFLSECPGYARRSEENERWLYIDRIDPLFGIKGSTQDVHIRRAYRRINSSRIFQPLALDDVSLANIHHIYNNSKSKSDTSYVLVESSRLHELKLLETVLVDEKYRLQEQCTMAFTSIQSDLHTPRLITKLAISKLINEDKMKVMSEIYQLQSKWNEYCRVNHYNHKSTLVKKGQSIASLSLLERMMEIELKQPEEYMKQVRRERDTMTFEDDLSHLHGQLSTLQDRLHDYEVYCILAARYGKYSAQEYNSSRFPGKKYFRKVSHAVNEFQRLWSTFWAWKSALRHKSSIRIQTAYRAHWAWRKYHPLIKCRMRFGKRTYYMWCIARWKSYNRILKMCKEAIIFYQTNPFKKLCFTSWTTYYTEIKEEKERKKKKLLARLRNSGLLKCFTAWHTFVVETKTLLREMRRKMQNPHFGQWIRYTEWSKMMKRLNKTAVKIQSIVRMFVLKRKYKRFKTGKAVFNGVLETNRLRRILAAHNMITWVPLEKQRRHTAYITSNRKSFIILTKQILANEKKRIDQLRSHFMTKHGKKQLKLHSKKFHNEAHTHAVDENNGVQFDDEGSPIETPIVELKVKKGNKEQASESGIELGEDPYVLAEKDLIQRYIKITNELLRHDYHIKHPNKVRCPDPTCHRCILDTMEQLEDHLRLFPKHQSLPSNFNRLYFLLGKEVSRNVMLQYLEQRKAVEASSTPDKVSGGRKGFLSFLGADKKVEDLTLKAADVINNIECWCAIQEWKRHESTTAEYFDTALLIYQTHLSLTASKPVTVDKTIDSAHVKQYGDIMKKLEYVFRWKSHNMFMRKVSIDRNWFLKIIGFTPIIYDEWTEDYTLAPSYLLTIEWLCVISTIKYFSSSYADFIENPESNFSKRIEELHQAHIIEVDKQWKLDYRASRYTEIRRWAADYKYQRDQRLKQINATIDEFCRVYFEELVSTSLYRCVTDHIRETNYPVQSRREETNAIVADVVYWSSAKISDEITTGYINTIVNTMLDIPSQRKKLLTFCGFSGYEKKLEKKLLIDLDVKNEAHELFKDLFG